MLRILGFITGAAVAIATIVIVMGTPELIESPTADATQELAFAVDVPDEVVTATVAEVPPEPEPPLATEPPVEAELLADLDLFTAAELPTEELVEPVETPAPLQTPDLPTEPEELLAADTPATDIADAQWHSFWNPFRSQIAANGFAARLSAVTDIDYRVVRLKPGAYQVAFAYTDDNERVAKLAQIQTATGLNLPEAAP